MLALGLTAWFPADGHASHPAPARWRALALHTLLESLPAVMLLTALAAALHARHFTEPLTPQTMRLVHRIESGRWLPTGLTGEGPDVGITARVARHLEKWVSPRWNDEVLDPARADASAPTVTILRITPEAGEAVFGRTSPVPRPAMAAALERLAETLEARLEGGPPGDSRPVVGLDIDITALQESAADEAEQRVVLAAVQRLLLSADLVGVVMPRSTLKARQARNASMEQLCLAGMHFATAATFVDSGEPHYRFRGQADGGWPNRPFPSLGNEMAALALGWLPSATTIRNVDESRAQLPGIAAQCRRADALLRYVDPDPADPAGDGRDYKWALLDLVRANDRTSQRAVTANGACPARLEFASAVPATLTSVNRPGRHLPKEKVRPMLLLSYDDDRSDKHFTVADFNGLSDGDFIHAATALSFIEPLHELSPGSGFVADLAIGVIYAGAWAMVLPAIRRCAGRGWTWWSGVGLNVAPAALAGTLGLAALTISAHALHWHPPIWIDPLLMLAGMTLHAYVTLGESAADPEGRVPAHSQAQGDRRGEKGWALLRLVFFVVMAGRAAFSCH